MDISRTCCFIGSRPQKLPWKNENDRRCLNLLFRLEAEVLNAIKKESYHHFISGMAPGIDQLAAKLVLLIKFEHPDFGITLEAALPCKNQVAHLFGLQQKNYGLLCSQADKCTYVSDDFKANCMQIRNEFMINHSSLIIAVTDGQAGGTMKAVRYATLSNKKVVILKP